MKKSYLKSQLISPESLLKIPLVRHSLEDKSFKIRRRAISKEWYYTNIIPLSITGFNPLLSSAFIGKDSQINKWLMKPTASARPLNKNDYLVNEVLLLAHDYLHSWAYLIINELNPKLGFGTKPIDEKNFEDFVFCHLLTESIAIVGLDYWYFSTIELNEVCPIGSGIHWFAVPYKEKWLGECRKFNPSFEVQNQNHLETILGLYCKGYASGFDIHDIDSSPILYRWLAYEISYAELQRQYTRQWLYSFRSRHFSIGASQLKASIGMNKKWQKDLIKEISHLLWQKVKEEQLHQPTFRFQKNQWRPFQREYPDLRFMNLNSLDEEKCFRDILTAPNLEENFKYLFYQYVSSYEYSSFNKELIEIFPFLIDKKDFKLIKNLFKNEKRIKKLMREPEDLFFLN